MTSSKEEEEKLFQLKIDFLSFIEQILDWQNPNIAMIIYALLMEDEKVTQSHLMDLTGLSRSTISETLSLIINDPRGIPVLQTRKKGDNRKYYYCPLSFAEYVKRLVGGSLNTIEINLEFIPRLLKQLRTIHPQNVDVKHVEKFFTFFYKYNHVIQSLIAQSDRILDIYFKNLESDPDFGTLVDNDILELNIDEVLESIEVKKKDISLFAIKKAFLEEMIKLGSTSSSGANKEIALTFFILYLEKEPITQDYIYKLTKSRRAAISEALNLLERQKFVKVIKKENDRKNYYLPNQDLSSFITARLQLSQHKINQIKLIIDSKFIPELESLNIDTETKKKLKKYFSDTALYNGIMGKWMKDMFDFIKAEISYPVK